jgi:hypothetical protein
MTFAEPQNTRPGSDSPQPLETATKPVAPRNGIDGRLRLYLGAVAVLALVLLVALESRPTTQASGLEAGPAAGQAGPVFDGRGKWIGYAR